MPTPTTRVFLDGLVAGPQGPQGVQGVQGTQGSFGGPQGPQGAQGAQGAFGGPQGTQGTQGTQGVQGAQGVQGTQGFTGAGVQGAQGIPGAQGAQGTQGASGGTGPQGAQGSQGAGGTGPQGAQGAPGAGTQGAQGAQGAQGTPGTQGAQGAQGTQGAQGAGAVGALLANGTVPLSAAWDVGNQRIDDVLAMSFDSEIDDGNSSTADTINWTTGALHKSTLTGNCTYTFTAPQPFSYVQLKCVQDGTGGRTVTLPGACVAIDGIVWQPNPAAGSESFWVGYYDGTSYYYYGRAPDSRVIAESTTARTFGLADSGAYIRTTNGSATTLTVPPNSTTAFQIGTEITGIQAGAGQVTFAQGAGVTINKPATRNLKTGEQFSTWALKKVGTNEWDLFGDLEVA